MLSNFRSQPFVEVSGNLAEKVSVVDDALSSQEQEIYLTTSIDKNCIEFESQTDRNYYLDWRQTYVALKLEFVKGRGYEFYNIKDVIKEREEKSKADVETEEEQEAPVLLVTLINNFLHSISSNVEVYINNEQIYNSNGLYAHKLNICSNCKAAMSEYK